MKKILASLEMTMRGLVALGVLAFQSPATSPQSLGPSPKPCLASLPFGKI